MDSRSLYQNKLDKLCFQYDMAYGEFRDLNRIRVAEKHCVKKHLILQKIRNIMDINMEFLQWFINFLIKKTSCETVRNDIIPNKE